ncbi:MULTISPECIES: ATP-dependent RNA helicase DbpA [unclassified Aliivibrio]|uniref:ATP-dependent RNA helicase DbpA n=1 Tax=unclassified Aliivibrio TaxID=2645654 RepID=UPI00080EAD2A|nr:MULTISPECIES: ATP-dependent RNA helicase DbpA [unclassified Aliivibrio]OCH16771.1 ATP-dependent RNA helicase DbpA [Aliivibrio sp. 1S165]OCH19191.1 ATP-dependent RNA helicase DbpA [Aliivibrio sp. 1S128]OCH32777.1 ATP-dependent RNA helicase DbpA [Aliivibrio sp. 1S175]
MSQTSFSSLDLHPSLLQNLDTLGYTEMTPIQAQSLPFMLKGKDVIAQGKTGSGKTAAFGLGLLANLDVKRFRVQSLVLCPTRELADQVAVEIRKLARSIHNIKVLTLCGGVPFGPQIGSLEHGAHIIVGTPGRVEEHLRKGYLNLDNLNTFVLDEADRMLEMGFQDAIDMVLDHAPAKRQNLLFSATFPPQIKSIADRIMNDPIMTKAEDKVENTSIEQHFYKVDDFENRLKALQILLLKHRPESTVIFCNTKRVTQEVADELRHFEFSVTALHGDLEQRDRDKALVRFANKSTSILVATDVAARGLDIDSLDAVINFELSRDPEVHVHRIGRTGRAGKKGIALSLFNNKETNSFAQIEDYMSITINDEPLPSEDYLSEQPHYPEMVTLWLDGGKKNKLRPGDILGALTGKDGVDGKKVGKINVFDFHAYVAVHNSIAKAALDKIATGKMKGRTFRVSRMRG